MAPPNGKTIEINNAIMAHMRLRAENYDTFIEAAKDALTLGAREFDINMASDAQPLVEKVVVTATVAALSAVPYVGPVASAAVSVTYEVASAVNAKDETNKQKLKKLYMVRTMGKLFRRLNASKPKLDEEHHAVTTEVGKKIGSGQQLNDDHLEQYKEKYPMVPKLTLDGCKKIEKRMLKELVKAHCKQYVYLILRNWKGCKHTLEEMTDEQWKWVKKTFLEINVIDDLPRKWGVQVKTIVIKTPKPGFEAGYVSTGGRII